MQDKLTDTKLERHKHKAARYDVHDSLERGLLIRVGAKTGRKDWWCFVYEAGKRRMKRLGSFPKMNVKEARLAAIAAKSSTGSRAGEHIVTVADLFAEYRKVTEPKRRSWRDVQISWDRWAKDRIGHLRIQDVTVHHGREMRNAITRESTELRANSVLRYIRPMFSWAADESLIDTNPWAGLKAKVVAEPRDRVLSHDEWLALWNAAGQDSYAPLWRFAMLSAQRIGNIASMRWDEIDGDVWTIPRDKFKATKKTAEKAHEVPLSRALLAIVNAQPRYGDYVFGTTGERPLSVGSRQRDRLAKASRVTDWVVHDLRRTGATLMAESKIDRFIIERVLGHADKGVTAVYDRASYRDQKRAALEVLAATVAPEGPNVSTISGPK